MKIRYDLIENIAIKESIRILENRIDKVTKLLQRHMIDPEYLDEDKKKDEKG
jgi:hypothetical protein